MCIHIFIIIKKCERFIVLTLDKHCFSLSLTRTLTMPGCPDVSERHSVLALLFYFAECIPSERHSVLPFSFISLGARLCSRKIVIYSNSAPRSRTWIPWRWDWLTSNQMQHWVTAMRETKPRKGTMRQSTSGTRSKSTVQWWYATTKSVRHGT